jgi:hypothetical protein
VKERHWGPPAMTAVRGNLAVTDEVQNYSIVVRGESCTDLKREGLQRARWRRLQPFVEVNVLVKRTFAAKFLQRTAGG